MYSRSPEVYRLWWMDAFTPSQAGGSAGSMRRGPSLVPAGLLEGEGEDPERRRRSSGGRGGRGGNGCEGDREIPERRRRGPGGLVGNKTGDNFFSTVFF